MPTVGPSVGVIGMARFKGLSDVDHDKMVKAVKAGEKPRLILAPAASPARYGRSRSPRPGPGWAQQLTNSLQALVVRVDRLYALLEQWEHHTRVLSRTKSTDGESKDQVAGSYGYLRVFEDSEFSDSLPFDEPDSGDYCHDDA